MKRSKTLIGLLTGLTAVAVFALAFTLAMPQTAAAHGGGPGGLMGRDGSIAGPVGGPDDTYLADALGITTAELQTAQQKAFEAALTQAVEKGLITQAQADQLKARGDFGRMGHLGFFGVSASDIDMEALLADALGITTEKLTAAKATAQDAALAQAVTDGRITQEQADLMKAQQALQSYLTDQGLQAQIRSLYEQSVADAVKAGIITQAQADLILQSQTDFGLRGFGGHGRGMGGHGRGMGGHGRGMGGMMPGFGGQNDTMRFSPRGSSTTTSSSDL